mgnify:CR=1 FL=1
MVFFLPIQPIFVGLKATEGHINKYIIRTLSLIVFRGKIKGRELTYLNKSFAYFFDYLTACFPQMEYINAVSYTHLRAHETLRYLV